MFHAKKFEFGTTFDLGFWAPSLVQCGKSNVVFGRLGGAAMAKVSVKKLEQNRFKNRF